jgi:hypothetical protein
MKKQLFAFLPTGMLKFPSQHGLLLCHYCAIFVPPTQQKHKQLACTSIIAAQRSAASIRLC